MMLLELLSQGAKRKRPSALAVEWPIEGRQSEHCLITLDPWLSTWGEPSAPALDLARVGVAAVLADQLAPRSTTRWSRELGLLVHVTDPGALEPAVELVELLLMWLTGDEWTIELVHDATQRIRQAAPLDGVQRVSLLSGGVDSLCGAVVAPPGTIFLGHSDTPAVRRAQNRVKEALSQVQAQLEYQQIELRAIADRKERSTRSRSFLFMALAVAMASARGAKAVGVPENGFTSLNPPLAANRGGPRTTRSTHPTTFAYANEITSVLGLDVQLENPFEWHSKGEVVEMAAAAVGRSWLEEALAVTHSCATQNTQWYKGGDPNLNCGICVACMTRRGAIRSAGLQDRSEYVVDRLTGDSLQKFLRERGADVVAVRPYSKWKADLALLCAMGPHSADFNYERALGLLNRGMKELVRGLPA